MAAYCNKIKSDKDDLTRKNRDRAKPQLIKLTPINVAKKPEEPEKNVTINLQHKIRGKLVFPKAEVIENPKRKEELFAAKKTIREERFLVRQREAEKFNNEYLHFTNFRIPVYESDEERTDRLTFEDVKYYAMCAKVKPKKTKPASGDDKNQQQRIMMFGEDEEASETSSFAEDDDFLTLDSEELKNNKLTYLYSHMN